MRSPDPSPIPAAVAAPAPVRIRSLDLVGARNWFFLASLIIIIPGIISMATQGFLLGIDFQGGTQLLLQFGNHPNLAQVQNAVSAQGVNGVVQQTSSGAFLIRSGSTDHSSHAALEPAPATRRGAWDRPLGRRRGGTG